MRLSDSERVTPNLPDRSDLMAEDSAHEAQGSQPQGGEETAHSSKLGFAPVLKNRNFLALWSGQVFSQLADKVYLVLMIALIASRFQDTNQTISGWVSVLMIAFTIPAVLFGSVAGVFVDRWSKKAVLVSTNILRGILVLAVPTLLWITQGWKSFYDLPVGFYVLLGITFLVSTLTQFFAPAEQAVIPLIVNSQNLLAANSLYTTTMMASLIIGFAVGEPVLALADTLVRQLVSGWDFGKELVVGGFYVIAGLLLLLLKTGENRETPEGEPPHVWQDIREGLSYVRHHRRIRNALIQLVILFSVFAAISVLAVRLAETLPGLKASQFGFLLSAAGVGMACGAAILGYWNQRLSHAQLSLYGSVGMAGSLVGVGLFTHHLALTLLMTTFLGGFAAMVAIPMQTTIQAETPPEMRGKVFGLQNNAINIALSLPLALAGFAETLLGLRTVFFGLAALVIAGGVLNWYISRTGSSMSTKADK
jgi:MFS family permease